MKKRKYLANREWSKDLKFNGHWYHLQAIFDKDQNDGVDGFDFNTAHTDIADDLERSSQFDFNSAIETGRQYNNMSIMDDIDTEYSDLDLVNEWTYLKSIDGNNLNYDEDKNFVVKTVLDAVNRLFDDNQKTTISFGIHYYIPNSPNYPFHGSRILINKNIIGHTIEDLIFSMVKTECEKNGMDIYHNYLDGVDTTYQEDRLVNSKTYDIKIIYKDKIYFFEVKSGEHRYIKQGGLNKLDIGNMRIHQNQMDHKNDMIFIVCDYIIKEKSKNIVELNKIELIDGQDISTPKQKETVQ